MGELKAKKKEMIVVVFFSLPSLCFLDFDFLLLMTKKRTKIKKKRRKKKKRKRVKKDFKICLELRFIGAREIQEIGIRREVRVDIGMHLRIESLILKIVWVVVVWILLPRKRRGLLLQIGRVVVVKVEGRLRGRLREMMRANGSKGAKIGSDFRKKRSIRIVILIVLNVLVVVAVIVWFVEPVVNIGDEPIV